MFGVLIAVAVLVALIVGALHFLAVAIALGIVAIAIPICLGIGIVQEVQDHNRRKR